LKDITSRAADPELEPGAGATELGILPEAEAAAGAQIKNQEPELSLKFGTVAEAMAI